MKDIKTLISTYSQKFNLKLANLFVMPQGPEQRVVEAMKYSVMNGGKRLRPFLVSETAKLFSIPTAKSFPTAAALEMLHSYSLIHDDLPAMDNDDLRRGLPTCHKKFDEATAILAGDGLLTYAFEIINSPKASKETKIRCELVQHLSQAAGAFNGMIAGQMLDLYAEKISLKEQNETLIKNIEEMKTGCLIRFACEAGAILGQANKKQRQALVEYSRKIGIAFQIADDILDVEGEQALVGKTLHKDVAQGKITFVSLYGIENARKIAQDLIIQAQDALSIFGKKAINLKLLASYIIDRKY